MSMIGSSTDEGMFSVMPQSHRLSPESNPCRETYLLAINAMSAGSASSAAATTISFSSVR
jgi:hypothetical protein